MKRTFTTLLIICILLCTTLTGCSEETYKTNDWTCVYSSVNNKIYEDDLEYKIKIYAKDGSLLCFDEMQVRVEIFKSSNLDEPYVSCDSEWLVGVAGVDLKHTMTKDTQMSGFYEKYMCILAEESSISMLNEAKKEGVQFYTNKRAKELATSSLSSFEDVCNEYNKSCLKDANKAAMSTLFGSFLDSATQYTDFSGISNGDLNTISTKTYDFLDDCGIYVDEEDVDLTFNIKDNVLSILDYLFDINEAALIAAPETSEIAFNKHRTACKKYRNELIELVLDTQTQQNNS